MDLIGKTFVVTGATSGIGQAAARQLAERGAHVIGVGRSPEKCRQQQDALAQAYPQAKVKYLVADLSLQSHVRRLADEITTHLNGSGLHGLINNAGAVPFWYTLTAEGFETQWATNHLAGFLLTHLLLPELSRPDMARVVTVSSNSHYGGSIHWDDVQMRRRYQPLKAYQQSKLANVLFSAEFNRRRPGGPNLRAFAADPGLVKTDIGAKKNPGLVGWVWRWRASGGISPDESARGVVFLACEPSIHDSPDVYWKHSRPKPPTPYALDPAHAARLWELSAQMAGLPYAKPAPQAVEEAA